MALDQQAQNLLSLLVSKLHTVTPGRPETYIGYKECHDLLDLPQLREKWGESLKPQGLSSLAEWTVDNNLPAITGIIISKSSNEPGPGYFTLFGRQQNPYAWWNNEIVKSKAFDWSPYVSTDFDLTPSDLEAPERKDLTISQIIRDTNISKEVKRLNQFKCQICGLSLDMPEGKKYIEAHHIKPLGAPHNGPDSKENLICVCPNHHAMLDYGAINLDSQTLKFSEGHRISEEFISYHNENIHKP
ncbi:MAG: HNH endonuclease [Candidatus Contendobacter sp.]|nr:HNH endonuclease [Candidatus Contendobacter sp.]